MWRMFRHFGFWLLILMSPLSSLAMEKLHEVDYLIDDEGLTEAGLNLVTTNPQAVAEVLYVFDVKDFLTYKPEDIVDAVFLKRANELKHVFTTRQRKIARQVHYSLESQRCADLILKAWIAVALALQYRGDLVGYGYVVLGMEASCVDSFKGDKKIVGLLKSETYKKVRTEKITDGIIPIVGFEQNHLIASIQNFLQNDSLTMSQIRNLLSVEIEEYMTSIRFMQKRLIWKLNNKSGPPDVFDDNNPKVPYPKKRKKHFFKAFWSR